MRVESQVTSLSWIPSEAVSGVMKPAFATGLAHYDPPPPDLVVDLDELRRTDRFRFANQLRAWAEFADDGTPLRWASSGGLSMGSTTVRVASLGVTFAAVGMPELHPEPELGPTWVRFRQTTGGRTALPLPRSIPKPPFVRLRAPLVWTTLTLTLHADGRSEFSLLGASPFPRHWVYGPDGALALKAGTTDYTSWLSQPSVDRTPWGDEDSPAVVTAAESALERDLSARLMRAGRKPDVRKLGAGAVLAEQGAPGDTLYLLLDGVLGVSVDGQPLGEVGPGAVLGERAILEGGTRTATLTAVTPVRVATAPADAIDLAALRELSAGHRREDGRTGAAPAAP